MLAKPPVQHPKVIILVLKVSHKYIIMNERQMIDLIAIFVSR